LRCRLRVRAAVVDCAARGGALRRGGAAGGRHPDRTPRLAGGAAARGRRASRHDSENTTMTARGRDDGFSIVELTVALALTLTVAAAVGAMAGSSRDAFAAQPERTDLQQRLRVGVDALVRDLTGAGAGSPVGGVRGPLVDALPPVVPRRLGA